MSCDRHRWNRESECPDCAVEGEQKALGRDLAALACVNTAYKIALGYVHPVVRVHPDQVAKLAYELADAMLAERDKVKAQ